MKANIIKEYIDGDERITIRKGQAGLTVAHMCNYGTMEQDVIFYDTFVNYNAAMIAYLAEIIQWESCNMNGELNEDTAALMQLISKQERL